MTTNAPSTRTSREVANLHAEIFDFLCTYHRIKRTPSKDSNPGTIVKDIALNNEQRGELINRLLYKILNEIDLRISVLPTISEPITPDYYEEWAFLTWNLLSIINRLKADTDDACSFLDYGGKHFQEKINIALVELVNKAQRMQPPTGVQQCDPHFERFYQSYVSTLISLHHLMNNQQISQQRDQQTYLPSQQKWLMNSEFESQIAVLKEQISACFQCQRDFCNNHNYLLWRQVRESQIEKMTQYGFENKGFMDPAISFYSNILYNLGVMAARLQGFWYELKTSKPLANKADLVVPLLQMVNTMVEVLLSDSLICQEPSQSAILVTNNLFPMKIVSLCRIVFFKEFSLQIVSEEVAQQIQQEMRHRKTFEPLVPIRPSASAALLAMKPATGVKRNNATASAEGGNTAHKKSDVNSKEWISIPPSFDMEQHGWVATYPHLLCTTRQKDTLLDTRSTGQTGKRPLFYFHVKAEMFNVSGGFAMAHSLSLPFTIATRRNQDCQVQRMMSSYTATCFWLYGTNVIDGLMIQWYDNEIEWKHFKLLYAQYFALNAEVCRSLVDADFNILKHKIHCAECIDRNLDDNEFSNPVQQQFQKPSELTVTFKSVLCPHLHYVAGKTDLRFSIWRGMLELLHLFSDGRTEVKTLWENGLLQGFMELDDVHNRLQAMDSGLIMRLSFTIGGCICFSVKSGGQILNLEPLDIRRLQAKSLYEYLRDILNAENVEYVLAMSGWIHVTEMIKMCQQKPNAGDSYNVVTKEIKSNILDTGAVEVEKSFRFTALRVAVVTCKEPNPNSPSKNANQQGTHAASDNSNRKNGFVEQLDGLMRTFGKSSTEVIELLRLQNGLSNGYSPPSSNNIGNLGHPAIAPTINNCAHHLRSGIITPNVSPAVTKQAGAQQTANNSSSLDAIGAASSTNGLMPPQISSSIASFSSIPSIMPSSNTIHFASSSTATYHHSSLAVIPSTSAPTTIMMSGERHHQPQHHADPSMVFTHQDHHISAMHSHNQHQETYLHNMVAMTATAATTATSSSMMDKVVFSSPGNGSESVDRRNVDVLEQVAHKQRCLDHHHHHHQQQQQHHTPSLWNHDRKGTGGHYQMSGGNTVVASSSALTSSAVAELSSQQPPITSFGGALDSLLNFPIAASSTAPPMSHPEYKI